ncbi:MAG: STAS domain-containing protein [Ilumatobacteraceae bacterium]
MDVDFESTGALRRLTLSTCTVDVETTPNNVLLTVIGELDMGDADRVGDLLAEAAGAGKPIVRVDLAGLTFADSSAIKALLLGAKAADEHGVTYELVNPHASVRRLLGVTGLDNALTVIDEPEFREGPNSA